MAAADRIVGYQELCDLTGKSRRTIRRWFLEGRLRRVKFAGVAGVWESELVAALGWHGTGGLVVDVPADADNDLDDALDDPADDGDANLD